jgi:hypothetical protein
MGFKQSYKGIFQFENQSRLDRAMAETQAEALGTDAMGLQDSFHAEGVMLINIDLKNGSEEDWEEMAVAMATLSMHASRGFVHATAQHGTGSGIPEVEIYTASGGGMPPVAPNSDAAPAIANDFFPMVEGAKYHFKTTNMEVDVVHWEISKIEAHGTEFYSFSDPEFGHVHFNNYWDSAYFNKDRSLVSTVHAANEEELNALDMNDPFSHHDIYNNQGKPGDESYCIWAQDNIYGLFVQEAFEDVTVPAGTYPNCMKIRAELYHVEGPDFHQQVQYQYFAKGVGIVKWEKGDSKLELSSVHM